MKLSRQLLMFSLCSIFIFTGCKSREPHVEKVTIFNSSLDDIDGPEEEVTLVKSFPKAFYKIYAIPGLGSFYLDTRIDIIKNELRAGHIWESNIVDLIRQYAKPGTIAIDIGSHIGTHTLSMSKFVGENGRVIAFEPQIKIFSELVMNMNLNKCKNVTAYRCAVGDTFQTIEMGPAVADNEGGTSIGKGGDVAEMITLDSLNLNNVSFIKIDVENLEYEVLKGAEQTIRRNHPYMIIEVMENTYNPVPDRAVRVQKTLNFIEEMGYTQTYIEGSWSDWLATPIN